MPNLGERLFTLYIGIANSTYGPTGTHTKLVEWVEADLASFDRDLKEIEDNISALAKQVVKAGGPYIEGM